MNFDINFRFHIKPFSCTTKSVRTKVEQSFLGEIKSIFYHSLKGFQLPEFDRICQVN